MAGRNLGRATPGRRFSTTDPSRIRITHGEDGHKPTHVFDTYALDSFDQYLQDVERYPLIENPQIEREIAARRAPATVRRRNASSRRTSAS